MIEPPSLVLDGEDVRLPADWPLHLVSWGDGFQAFVQREGRLIPLAEALHLRDLLTSTSATASRTALDGRKGHA